MVPALTLVNAPAGPVKTAGESPPAFIAFLITPVMRSAGTPGIAVPLRMAAIRRTGRLLPRAVPVSAAIALLTAGAAVEMPGTAVPIAAAAVAAGMAAASRPPA